MPGFLGCVSTSSSVQTKIAQIREYEERALSDLAYYTAGEALSDPNGLVLTLLPRLRINLGGAWRDPDGAGSVAYVGRFEEAPFPRTGDNAQIARSLWELYRARGKMFAQALAGSYLGGEYKLLATFVVLVVVLMIRPYGLFGTHEIERL